jgi:hypothetical protein
LQQKKIQGLKPKKCELTGTKMIFKSLNKGEKNINNSLLFE